MEKKPIIKELNKIVGKRNVYDKKSQVICYRFGNVIDYRFKSTSALPDFVLTPQSTSHVSAILKLANKYKIPVVPWGGGTDFTGANSPVKGGMVIDMKNFEDVKLNKKENYIVAGSGAPLISITEEAEKNGFLFPHEIATQKSATIGGAIATNSFGYRSGRYRSIRNLILGIEAVLPNGEIIRTKPLFKTSTGYDLVSLMVGSEGTLGIITEVTLRVFPKPESREIFTYIFNSFNDGFKACTEIWRKLTPEFFALGELSFLKESKTPITFFTKSSDSKFFSSYLNHRYINPSLFGQFMELIISRLPQTGRLLRYVNRTILKKNCIAILTVGFEGKREVVKIKKHRLKAMVKPEGGVRIEDDSFYRDRFKSFAKLKEIIEDHFPENKDDFYLATFDLSLPTGEVIKAHSIVNKVLRRYKTIHILYSELYSSIFTLGFDLLIERKDGDEYFNFLNEITAEILKLGGSLSFAHGIGTRFLPFIGKDLGESYLNFMKKVKNALDPLNILNPGKLGDF